MKLFQGLEARKARRRATCEVESEAVARFFNAEDGRMKELSIKRHRLHLFLLAAVAFLASFSAPARPERRRQGPFRCRDGNRGSSGALSVQSRARPAAAPWARSGLTNQSPFLSLSLSPKKDSPRSLPPCSLALWFSAREEQKIGNQGREEKMSKVAGKKNKQFSLRKLNA